MINIQLQRKDDYLSHGYHVLKRILTSSEQTIISYEDYYVVDDKYRRKEEGFTIAKIDGITVAIDANGGCGNIKSMYEDGLFDSVLKDVKVIIKTQYKYNPFWEIFKQNTGIKVTPWIMWSTINFPLCSFSWAPTNHKYLASCAGGRNSNRRWGRPPYINYCKNDDRFHSQRMLVNEYIEILKKCKWGLILQGGNKYNCDGKNTREIEYASCGMPLVLNYCPTYDFSFEPNKHFLYLEKPEDLEKLEYINPEPYAKASEELWHKYFKPESAVSYLMELIHE